jgi:hypothetical protein
MTSPLRRRLDALERSGLAATMTVDGRVAQAFVDFIAETFGREGGGSYADAAARFIGLPSGSHFQQFCAARFDLDAYPDIARAVYGEDWARLSEEVAQEAAERCRAVHGEDWASVMADRMRTDNRPSRYQ